MEIREVDPYDVNVDEMNERTENLNLGELERSVAEQGVIQPPIVRKRNGDAEVPYSVVVGQRRTLAAQGAGLESMPVVVMDWDDTEALEASITENIDAFREKVSAKDRAIAISRLKQEQDLSNQAIADKLGVTEMAIRSWLEPTRREWEGTILDPDVSEAEIQERDDLDVEEIRDIPTDDVRRIREVTGGGEEGERALEKVAQHDLSKEDIQEVKKKVKSGRSMDEAIAQRIEEKHDDGDIQVSAKVTFTGDSAGALSNYAKDRGMTESEVIREAIRDYLGREGYL